MGAELLASLVGARAARPWNVTLAAYELYLADQWIPLGWLEHWYVSLPRAIRRRIIRSVLRGEPYGTWSAWLDEYYAGTLPELRRTRYRLAIGRDDR